MEAVRWDELEALFERVDALPEKEQRSFLDEVCRSDAKLCAELNSLLAFRSEAQDFFDSLADSVLPSAILDIKRQHDPDPYRLAGKTVSHYRILEPLGGGGMGFVYRAEDLVLRRAAALKFLPPGVSWDEEAKARFMHEAQAASALDHPNVCAIYEVGETEEGQLFIAMAYYAGETLREKIARGPLPASEAVEYTCQIAEGLSAAHAQGIVHRDIKPANVMVTPDGTVKLIDFGLAKLANRTQLTREGAVIGTVAYMSPEQLRGDPVDHRTDIWSLGVVLYEMLTGERPFRGEHEQAVVYAILNKIPAPLARLHSAGFPDLTEIVARCLEKDPARRSRMAEEVLAALGGRRGAGLAWRRPSWRRWRITHPFATRFAGVTSVVLVLAGSYAVGLSPFTSASRSHLPTHALHVAVLPFTTVEDDPDDQMLAEGLALTVPDILEQVSRVTKMPITVAPVTRSARMESAKEAARKLGVQWVVQGRILDNDDRLRVVLDVINTTQPSASEAKTITISRANRASLQARVAGALAEAFDIDLSAEARYALSALTTRNSEAYTFYLQGRTRLRDARGPDNVDTAIQSFQWSLEEDSLFALAHAGLCAALWMKFDVVRDTSYAAEAQEPCTQAARLHERLPMAREALGTLYIGTGAYEQARQEFQAALVLDSSSAAAYRGLAIASQALGYYREAELNYRRAIALEPGNWSNYNFLGDVYLAEGRYDDAAAQFVTVIRLDSSNLWGLNNLGSAYLYMDEKVKAREMFERAIALQPNDYAYANLGVIYYYEGRFAEEARMFEKALSIDSSDFRVWGNLAGAYTRIPEEAHKADSIYARAARMAEAHATVNPNNWDVLMHLASYYLQLEHPVKARIYIEQALALAPDNVDLMVQAGSIYESLGDRGKAIEWIIRAQRNGYPQEMIESDAELAGVIKDPEYNERLGI